MVNAAWRSFADEIARWQDAGRTVDFWWRDDDAFRPTPALSRLFALAAEAKAPLALAVVPEAAVSTVLEEAPQAVAALQHGADHRNRAIGGEKKTEFSSAEPVELALERLTVGRRQLESVAGSRTLGVLAPPWNRLAPGLVPRLAMAGYHGLSTYGARKTAAPSPGLRQVNTHVDVIAWKGGRGFAGEEYVLAQATAHLGARRTGQVDVEEPTGWLTHHAVHDEATWTFLAQMFETTRAMPGVHWLDAQALFPRTHAD